MSAQRKQFFYEEESRDGTGHLFGGHDDRLFDQDENSAGELSDLVTGKKYDNSRHSYDRLRELTDEEAGEIGMSIVDGPYYEDDGSMEYVDHWLETQEGLARAAERGISLDDNNIA